MSQKEKGREVHEGDRNGEGIEVEPKSITQLHPMLNRKGEARLVETYAGSMGRPNVQDMYQPGNWSLRGAGLHSWGVARQKVELMGAGR